MHILLLHQYFCPPGGAGNNRSYEFAQAWVAAGHCVTVCTTTAYFPAVHVSRENFHSSFDLAGIRVHAWHIPYAQQMGYPKRISAFLGFYRALTRFKPQLKPDIIYAISTPPTVTEAGRWLAKQFSTPLLVELMDVWPEVPIGMGIVKNPLLIWVLKRLITRIYQAAQAVIVLSEGAASLAKAGGVSAGKVHVVHNGADTTNLRPLADKQGRTPVKLIYAGAIGKANGLEQLLAALEMLAGDTELPTYECEIIGWGSEWVGIRDKAQIMGLTNVSFLPPVPKEAIGDALAQADIGIVCFAPYPVLETNSANKFFDYLAIGLPVVINYRGWQAEYLNEWQAGLSSPQGDIAAFAANLKTLLHNTNLRKQMGANARRLAVEKFDRKQLAAEVLALLVQATTLQ